MMMMMMMMVIVVVMKVVVMMSRHQVVILTGTEGICRRLVTLQRAFILKVIHFTHSSGISSFFLCFDHVDREGLMGNHNTDDLS